MPCINCLQNCGGNFTSDQCVEYTGDDIPALGICCGDQLSKLETAVVNSLLTALNGTGISPSDVTLANCSWLSQQFVGKDPTLANYLQLIFDSECSLKSMINEINIQIAGGNAVFTISCLSGLPANPTSTQVLQALTADYCSLKTTVTAIPTTYVKLSDLQSQVTQILDTLGITGGSTTIQYAQYIPIGVVLPYFGSLANFDNNGVGLASAGFTGLSLCNGVGAAPDFRGRGLVGAVRNVPGGTLDNAVDPTKSFNPNTNYSLGDKFGENYHFLTTSEIPIHSHEVNDPGHSHPIKWELNGTDGTPNGQLIFNGDGEHNGSGTNINAVLPSSTGVTIKSTGGNSFHNNIQPSAAVYFIIRLQ